MTKTDIELDNEANQAIDDCVRQLTPAIEYAPTISNRNSILCKLLRGVYFEGRRQGLADAQDIFNDGK